MKFRPNRFVGGRIGVTDHFRLVAGVDTLKMPEIHVKERIGDKVCCVVQIKGVDVPVTYDLKDGELIDDEPQVHEKDARQTASNAYVASVSGPGSSDGWQVHKHFKAGWDACLKHLKQTTSIRIKADPANPLWDDREQSANEYADSLRNGNDASTLRLLKDAFLDGWDGYRDHPRNQPLYSRRKLQKERDEALERLERTEELLEAAKSARDSHFLMLVQVLLTHRNACVDVPRQTQLAADPTRFLVSSCGSGDGDRRIWLKTPEDK